MRAESGVAGLSDEAGGREWLEVQTRPQRIPWTSATLSSIHHRDVYLHSKRRHEQRQKAQARALPSCLGQLRSNPQHRLACAPAWLAEEVLLLTAHPVARSGSLHRRHAAGSWSSVKQSCHSCMISVMQWSVQAAVFSGGVKEAKTATSGFI
jgi:hypothetical protein